MNSKFSRLNSASKNTFLIHYKDFSYISIPLKMNRIWAHLFIHGTILFLIVIRSPHVLWDESCSKNITSLNSNLRRYFYKKIWFRWNLNSRKNWFANNKESILMYILNFYDEMSLSVGELFNEFNFFLFYLWLRFDLYLIYMHYLIFRLSFSIYYIIYLKYDYT